MNKRLNITSQMKAFLISFFTMGAIYLFLESIWRGNSNITMIFIGGFCGAIVGILNQAQRFTNLKIWQQCLLGSAVIVFVEFVSGCIFNIWLGWDLWDYSNIYGNIYGQVCFQYAFIWFLLCPFIIWFNDLLRLRLFGQSKYHSLSKIFTKLLLLK